MQLNANNLQLSAINSRSRGPRKWIAPNENVKNCDSLNDNGFRTALVNRHPFIYKGPGGQQIDPLVAVFQTEDAASTATRVYAQAVAGCLNEFVSALRLALSANGWSQIAVGLDRAIGPSAWC